MTQIKVRVWFSLLHWDASAFWTFPPRSAPGGFSRSALGIKTDGLAKHCLKDWPTERKARARIIGNWLQEEAEFLA